MFYAGNLLLVSGMSTHVSCLTCHGQKECLAGGEMFHHLDLAGAFDEPTAMFYAGNVLLALEHLHSRGLVYRDLKPENLLFDAQGYCKIADFGFAKKIGADKTYTICGTPDYQVTYCYSQSCC